MAFEFTTTNKAMPLVLRKNIKEHEPTKAENLAKIKDTTGRDFEFELEGDIMKLYENTRYQDRLAEIFFNAYLGGIANFLQNNKQKDEFVYNEFLSNLTANKIVVRCTEDEKPSGTKYQRYSVEYGKLYATFTRDDFWVNIGDLETFACEDVDVIGVDSKGSPEDTGKEFSKDNKSLSLTLRKNIKDFEEARDTHLKEIASILGEEMTLRIDYEPIISDPDFNSDLYGRLGEIFFDYVLGQIPKMFRNHLDDEMSKEAFLDEVSKRSIVFGLAPEKKKSGEIYHRVRIVDGEMLVEMDADQVWTNIDDLGNFKIDQLL